LHDRVSDLDDSLPIINHLRVSLGGLADKTPIVGAPGREFNDDPLMNSKAIFNSTNVLEEGTIFIFGS